MKTQANSNVQKTILVLGGRGFIGRHVVKHLALLGANVITGSRQKDNKNISVRQTTLHDIKKPEDCITALEGIDVVINTVGILRQRYRETYDQVHHQAVKSIADACAKTNTRFVHISALGLQNPVKSRFSISKRNGEQAIKNSRANWAIVRPSLVDGEGGFGARWFQWVAKWPIYFIPQDAKGVFAPINANDLGEAIARIALMQTPERTPSNRIYELGGNQQVHVLDYLKLLRPNRLGAPALVIKIPAIVARTFSHLFDLIQFSPYSFGHYEMLKNNNLPVQNHLQTILGRPATAIGIEESLEAEPSLNYG